MRKQIVIFTVFAALSLPVTAMAASNTSLSKIQDQETSNYQQLKSTEANNYQQRQKQEETTYQQSQAQEAAQFQQTKNQEASQLQQHESADEQSYEQQLSDEQNAELFEAHQGGSAAGAGGTPTPPQVVIPNHAPQERDVPFQAEPTEHIPTHAIVSHSVVSHSATGSHGADAVAPVSPSGR